MTDSGWDIPGIPRDALPGADAADGLAAPSAGPAGMAAGRGLLRKRLAAGVGVPVDGASPDSRAVAPGELSRPAPRDADSLPPVVSPAARTAVEQAALWAYTLRRHWSSLDARA